MIKAIPPTVRGVAAVLLAAAILVSCGSPETELAAPTSTESEQPVPTTAPVDAPDGVAEEAMEAAADPVEAPDEVTDSTADEPGSSESTEGTETAAARKEGDDDSDDQAEGTSEPDDAQDTAVPVANAVYLDSYTLVDETFGTMVTVTVADGTRTIVSNALPNHATGDFPNSGNPNTISAQNGNRSFTTAPVFTGVARTARETGVALNGVKFEPGTGETVSCDTGENYRIEGLQSTFGLGMDFNNAHVQPTGEYHYHGVSAMLVDAFANSEDLVLVGFAADGHLMYYSKSGAYAPSYSLSTQTRTGTGCGYRTGPVTIEGSTPDGTYVSDWSFVAGSGDLDQCNGVEIDGEYAYIITEQYPFVSRCLMGEFSEAGPGGGAAPGAAPGGEAPAGAGPEGAAPDGAGAGPGGAPDLTAAAAALGLTSGELTTILGGPPPDFESAAATLGLTLEQLMSVLEANGAASRND